MYVPLTGVLGMSQVFLSLGVCCMCTYTERGRASLLSCNLLSRMHSENLV